MVFHFLNLGRRARRLTRSLPALLAALAWPLLAAHAQEPPPPAAPPAPAAVRLENYLLRAGDQLEIRVFREDNLTTRTQVAQDGTITFPLIGQVSVGGKTVAEAQQDITRALDRDYIVNPQVTISLSSYAKRRITFLGEVRRPGSYTLPDEEKIDLVAAIGLAGGFGEYASQTNIVVKRVENGREVVFKLNARDMARGKAKPFYVASGDVITIGQSIF